MPEIRLSNTSLAQRQMFIPGSPVVVQMNTRQVGLKVVYVSAEVHIEGVCMSDIEEGLKAGAVYALNDLDMFVSVSDNWMVFTVSLLTDD